MDLFGLIADTLAQESTYSMALSTITELGLGLCIVFAAECYGLFR